MRAFLIIGGSVIAGLAALFLGIGALTPPLFSCGRQEVSRLKSPGGDLEAVVMETNGGATTSFGYEVHVVAAGDELPEASCGEGQKDAVAFLYGALTDGNYGVSLEWLGPDRLSLTYGEARSAKVFRPQLSVAARTISVVLQQTGNAPAATDAHQPNSGLTPLNP